MNVSLKTTSSVMLTLMMHYMFLYLVCYKWTVDIDLAVAEWLACASVV
jgi:hypothetical protein